MTPKQAKERADELTRGKVTATVGSWMTNGRMKYVVNVTHEASDEEGYVRPLAYTLS